MTNSILSTAKSLVVLDDKKKSETLACLTTKLRWCYTSMLERVIRYKLVATKKNKLWVFASYTFSLNEGYKLCTECDAVLG